MLSSFNYSESVAWVRDEREADLSTCDNCRQHDMWEKQKFLPKCDSRRHRNRVGASHRRRRRGAWTYCVSLNIASSDFSYGSRNQTCRLECVNWKVTRSHRRNRPPVCRAHPLTCCTIRVVFVRLFRHSRLKRSCVFWIIIFARYRLLSDYLLMKSRSVGGEKKQTERKVPNKASSTIGALMRAQWLERCPNSFSCNPWILSSLAPKLYFFTNKNATAQWKFYLWQRRASGKSLLARCHCLHSCFFYRKAFWKLKTFHVRAQRIYVVA
jgi:hypothetical protein